MRELARMSDISKRYRRRGPAALTGINLVVREGEALGIIGPNGAGKTTLIRILLGLAAPSTGEVSLFNHRPPQVSLAPRVGYTPETPNLPTRLRAAEVMRLFGAIKGADSGEIEPLLDWVNLSGERGLVKSYSMGMRRRLGLAVALLGDPDLIVLDEPAGDLDPIGREELMNRLKSLKVSGKAIVFASHLLEDVQSFCDQVVILDQGEIRYNGSVNVNTQGLAALLREAVRSNRRGLQ